MARLDTIPSSEQKMMVELDCSGFEGRDPFVAPKTPERTADHPDFNRGTEHAR